jgi:hypothetical protein
MLRALHCRVPPRQAGNFHLRGQMKVTKAKALNATPFTRSARVGSPVQGATWRACGGPELSRARRGGLREASPALIRWTQGQREARPRRVRCRFDPRRWFQVARRAGCARGEERAERFCLEPLCFGDFHLGPQMKVTRPPGRDPAMKARHGSHLDKHRPIQTYGAVSCSTSNTFCTAGRASMRSRNGPICGSVRAGRVAPRVQRQSMKA